MALDYGTVHAVLPQVPVAARHDGILLRGASRPLSSAMGSKYDGPLLNEEHSTVPYCYITQDR